jgi:DNA-binding response OmpR family regulator
MKKLKDLVILYSEDDPIICEQFASLLKPMCKQLVLAHQGDNALELFIKYRPEIVITDIEIPVNGLSLAKEIRQLSLSTQIIITTAHKNQRYLWEAVNLQLTQYLLKPISLESMSQALRLSERMLSTSSVSMRKYFNNNNYYDTYSKELIRSNSVIELSKYERCLLELLIQKHPAPASYESISTTIYSSENSFNAIKLLVRSLRNKIDKQSVKNLSGYGYKLQLKNDFD